MELCYDYVVYGSVCMSIFFFFQPKAAFQVSCRFRGLEEWFRGRLPDENSPRVASKPFVAQSIRDHDTASSNTSLLLECQHLKTLAGAASLFAIHTDVAGLLLSR